MRNVLGLLQRIPFQHVRIVRFLLSGGTAVGVNLSILWIATEIFHVWYVLSAVLGTGASFFVSFILHKFWTFENEALNRVHVQFSQYVILGLTNIGVNALLVYLLVEYGHLWYILAQIISTGVIATCNFFIYRHLIFKHDTLSSNPRV